MELAQIQSGSVRLGRSELSLRGGLYGIRDRTFLSSAPYIPHADHSLNSLNDGSPERRKVASVGNAGEIVGQFTVESYHFFSWRPLHLGAGSLNSLSSFS